MTERFVISDTHFGHANILTFVNPDGTKVRTFSSCEEMDETMVENWNKVVKPHDVVYHLGDIVINKKYLPILDRLNGSKRLILGNHDLFHEEYPKYFKKVYAMRVFARKAILTHIPIHMDSSDRFGVNIHGHLHCHKVKDSRYINVCVENHNYTPIALDSLISV